MSVNTFLAPTPVVPGTLLISAITNTFPMVVTIVDSDFNTYAAGMNVHFTIPSSYGMFQLDQKTGEILSIDNLDFYVNIDARGFDVFLVPVTGSPMPASLSPGGSTNIYNITEAPFRSLNNQGN